MSTLRSSTRWVTTIIAGRRGLALRLVDGPAVVEPGDLGASVADLRAGGLRVVSYRDERGRACEGVEVDSLAQFAAQQPDKVPAALRSLHRSLTTRRPSAA